MTSNVGMQNQNLGGSQMNISQVQDRNNFSNNNSSEYIDCYNVTPQQEGQMNSMLPNTSHITTNPNYYQVGYNKAYKYNPNNNFTSTNPNYQSQGPGQPTAPNRGFVNKNNLTINNNTYQNITTFYTPGANNLGVFNNNFIGGVGCGNSSSNKFSSNNIGGTTSSSQNPTNYNSIPMELEIDSQLSVNESFNEDLVYINQTLNQGGEKDTNNNNILLLEMQKGKKDFKNIQETLKSNKKEKPSMINNPNNFQQILNNTSKVHFPSINYSSNHPSLMEESSNTLSTPNIQSNFPIQPIQYDANIFDDLEEKMQDSKNTNSNQNNNNINNLNNYEQLGLLTNIPPINSCMNSNLIYPQSFNYQNPHSYQRVVDPNNYPYGHPNLMPSNNQPKMNNYQPQPNFLNQPNYFNNMQMFNQNNMIDHNYPLNMNTNINPGNLFFGTGTDSQRHKINNNNIIQHPPQDKSSSSNIIPNVYTPKSYEMNKQRHYRDKPINNNPIVYPPSNNKVMFQPNQMPTPNTSNLNTNYDNNNGNINSAFPFNQNNQSRMGYNNNNFMGKPNYNNSNSNSKRNNFNESNILTNFNIQGNQKFLNKLKKVNSFNDILTINHSSSTISEADYNSGIPTEQVNNNNNAYTLTSHDEQQSNFPEQINTNNQNNSTYNHPHYQNNQNNHNLNDKYNLSQDQNLNIVNAMKPLSNEVDSTLNFSNFYSKSDNKNMNVLNICIKLKDSVKNIELKEGEDIYNVITSFIDQNNLSKDLIKPIYSKINLAIVSVKKFFCQQVSEKDKSYLNYLNNLQQYLENEKNPELFERFCLTDDQKDKEREVVFMEENSFKTI